MLLRFAVSNHLSIKDTQELSFIKSALKGPEDGLLSTPALPKDKVLTAAIIYGPNASGKTNLLNALAFMRSAILQSHSKWSPDAGIARSPFLLNKECKDSPSRFEIDFVVNDVRHNYGFTCSSKEFLEEWLYEAPFGRQRIIFERNGPLPKDLKFGSSFTGQRVAIGQLMRPNSLFLSAAFQNNHPLVKNVVSAFQRISFQSRIGTDADLLSRMLKGKKLDDRTMAFLKNIKTGIAGYQEVVNARPNEQVQRLLNVMMAARGVTNDTISDDERNSMLKDFENDFKVEFSHRSEDGVDIFFDASRESAGTLRLIPLLQEVMFALDNGNICVIDEIDASLHTQVCDAIIALFSNSKTNPNGAQIIATTHDTNLFNAPHLRRDELWLVEKSPGGASEFYSMADVKVRDTGNYERGYLHGRYGAIPFAGSAIELVKRL
jgi:AAA15 family ATPase/GTPase